MKLKLKDQLNRFICLVLVVLLSGIQPLGIAFAESDTAATPPATQEEQPPPASEPEPQPAPAPEPGPQPAPAPEPEPQPAPAPEPQSATTPAQSTPAATGGESSRGPRGTQGPVPKYAYNDATQEWVPTNQGSFSWDVGAGRWASPLYWYEAGVGWYHVIPGGAPSNSALAANPNYALAKLLGLSDPANTNTGPGSTNENTVSGSNNLLLEILAKALINNTSNSQALSGNAGVTGNTKGGDALSGPAAVVENLLNLVNAMWTMNFGKLAYFAENIFGDRTGDIRIVPENSGTEGQTIGGLTPGMLAMNDNTGPDSTNTATQTQDNDVKVKSSLDAAINNNINALAKSGSATVADNTEGGNATTGDATVNINILNMINSAINAGGSFFGMLNIFGNLNGDILFPDGFLDGIFGAPGTSQQGNTSLTNANTGPDSQNTTSSTTTNNADINNDVSSLFNNNINTAAQSGSANVSGNTAAGNASTGDAVVRNNLFNLVNATLFSNNAVLVLVNVMGSWVGHIMQLPQSNGSTGALLTGGQKVAQNTNTGPGSTNTATTDSNNNLEIDNTVKGVINNNITAGAVSGDAAVNNNTQGGNASSGDAMVATNVANIFGSSLNLSNWFGVLVINVFGDWKGSVGENTEAGNIQTVFAGFFSVKDELTSVFVSSKSSQTSQGNGFSSSSSAVSVSSDSSLSLTEESNVSSSGESVVASLQEENLMTKAGNNKAETLFLIAAIAMMLAAASFGAERKLRKQ